MSSPWPNCAQELRPFEEWFEAHGIGLAVALR